MTILNNHESCYSHFSINLVLGVGLEVGLLVPDVHGEAEDDRGGGEPGGRHPGQGRVTAGGRQSARHHQPHPSLACALYCPRHTLQQPGRSCAHARTGRKQPHHGPGPSLTVLSSGQVFVPRPAVTIHLLATLRWSCVLLCSPLKIPLLLLVTVSGCRCVVWRWWPRLHCCCSRLPRPLHSTLAQPLVTVRTRPPHTLYSFCADPSGSITASCISMKL